MVDHEDVMVMVVVVVVEVVVVEVVVVEVVGVEVVVVEVVGVEIMALVRLPVIVVMEAWKKKKQEKNESIHFKSAFLKRLKFKFLGEKSVIKEHCALTVKCQLRVFRIQHSQWKYGIHKNEKAYCHNKRLCAAF